MGKKIGKRRRISFSYLEELNKDSIVDNLKFLYLFVAELSLGLGD